MTFALWTDRHHLRPGDRLDAEHYTPTGMIHLRLGVRWAWSRPEKAEQVVIRVGPLTIWYRVAYSPFCDPATDASPSGPA